jgi:hypothetical protein
MKVNKYWPFNTTGTRFLTDFFKLGSFFTAQNILRCLFKTNIIKDSKNSKDTMHHLMLLILVNIRLIFIYISGFKNDNAF